MEHELTCNFANFVCNGEQEVIQEQITRVLLERLIVNRPHPWGLLITFIELIKVMLVHPINIIQCGHEIEPSFDTHTYVCSFGTLDLRWRLYIHTFIHVYFCVIYNDWRCYVSRTQGTTFGAGHSQGVHRRLRSYLSRYRDHAGALNLWKRVVSLQEAGYLTCTSTYSSSSFIHCLYIVVVIIVTWLN